jgi:prepilin-type processing-associated H-X9-DG protein
VVIAIIAILAALLLPVLGKAKLKAQRIACLNNQKQLTYAWLIYTDDSSGNLPFNVNNTVGPGVTGWVNGNMSWDFPPSPSNPDNTNWLLLAYSALSDYGAKSVAIYKCPGDIYNSARGPRVRTISMNGQMNGNTGNDPNGPAVLNQFGPGQNYKIFKKGSDIINPGPSMAWVFIDEQADSINDGLFHVDMKPGDNKWSDWPGNYHGSSGALSFADGHAETHKWTDPVIANRVVAFGGHTALAATSPYTDLQWLQQRTTSLE